MVKVQTIFKCAVQWRNRIGRSSSMPWSPKDIKTIDQSWSTIIHRRVAKYLKVFTCFLFYSTFFLVAHRNMVSIFDLNAKKFKKELLV